jgi:nucleotide-binding universal stress UspA family protein
MYGHILIPTDGSDFARKGVDEGLALAEKLGSSVTALMVTEPYPLYATSAHLVFAPADNEIERYEASQRAFAEAALEAVEKKAEKLGLNIETLHLSRELPSEAILKTAAERGCDLIVMASHGRRGISRLLLGSQTSQVLHDAKVPVLVVRN